jgi:hypothetical protein
MLESVGAAPIVVSESEYGSKRLYQMLWRSNGSARICKVILLLLVGVGDLRTEACMHA